VKDELARVKHLPPRPPIKPSGMDKSTQGKEREAGDQKTGRSSRRRGSQLDRLKIGATIVVKANPPAGSRNKGFEDIVVQDLMQRRQSLRVRIFSGALPTVQLARYDGVGFRVVLSAQRRSGITSGDVPCESVDQLRHTHLESHSGLQALSLRVLKNFISKRPR
jgi:hypothetical protein